ncbi:hypothetical protein ACHAQH_002117 [Verticillium albo-atrum]
MSTARNMRPTTPNLKIASGAAASGGMDPASPPQTPTSVSPALLHHQHHHKVSSRLPSNIRPIGNNHQFSYVRSANRFAQLSPQSSSEDDDDDEEDEDEDDDEEEAESDVESTETDLPRSSSDEEDDDDDENDDNEDDDDDDNYITNAPPLAAHNRLKALNTNDDDNNDDSEDEEEDEDHSDSDSDEDMLEPGVKAQSTSNIMHAPEPPTERTATVATFTVEELSDFDPMDDNRVGVIPPTSFEYPESDRSRSRSRGACSSASDAAADATGPKYHSQLPHRPRPYPDLDINMMQHLRNLNCSGSDDGEEEEDDLFDPSDDAAHKEFVLAQRDLKMRKRRSHGSSIGKRTHSERSDSDGKEDLPDTPWDAVGASARRLRRRVGDRRSLQFQDPPPERIEELEEPDSCEEDRGLMRRGFGMLFGDGETLARELPYYGAMEIMELDEDE